MYFLEGVTNINKTLRPSTVLVSEDAIQLDALSIDFDLQSATAGSHPIVTSVGKTQREREGNKKVRRN